VTNDQLTAVLAERIMGWTVGPDRLLMGNRGWMPRWRFRPTEKIEDAFRLLEATAPQEYAMGAGENGGFWARVRIAGTTGEARESSQARAMTLAIARAISLKVDASE
jgi:hypothetical protein